MPGGLGTGSSSSFRTGFDGGLGESGFGSRSQSFSTPEQGSTITYYTTGGGDQGGFSNTNMDLASLLGMNQNGFGMRKVWSQNNDDGVVRTVTNYRTIMSNPMGNGYSTVFRGGDSGRGNTGRYESDLNDYGSGMGGRGNSIGGSRDYGQGNGDIYGENDQPSEFGRSSGSGRGGNSNSFGFGGGRGGNSDGFGFGSARGGNSDGFGLGSSSGAFDGML